MDLTKRDSLPDYMDKKSLYNWFNGVLNYAESDKNNKTGEGLSVHKQQVKDLK